MDEVDDTPLARSESPLRDLALQVAAQRLQSTGVHAASGTGTGVLLDDLFQSVPLAAQHPTLLPVDRDAASASASDVRAAALKYMKEGNLSHATVAAQVGISPSQLSLWKAGKRANLTPRLHAWLQRVGAIGVDRGAGGSSRRPPAASTSGMQSAALDASTLICTSPHGPALTVKAYDGPGMAAVAWPRAAGVMSAPQPHPIRGVLACRFTSSAHANGAGDVAADASPDSIDAYLVWWYTHAPVRSFMLAMAVDATADAAGRPAGRTVPEDVNKISAQWCNIRIGDTVIPACVDACGALMLMSWIPAARVTAHEHVKAFRKLYRLDKHGNAEPPTPVAAAPTVVRRAAEPPARSNPVSVVRLRAVPPARSASDAAQSRDPLMLSYTCRTHTGALAHTPAYPPQSTASLHAAAAVHTRAYGASMTAVEAAAVRPRARPDTLTHTHTHARALARVVAFAKSSAAQGEEPIKAQPSLVSSFLRSLVHSDAAARVLPAEPAGAERIELPMKRSRVQPFPPTIEVRCAASHLRDARVAAVPRFLVSLCARTQAMEDAGVEDMRVLSTSVAPAYATAAAMLAQVDAHVPACTGGDVDTPPVRVTRARAAAAGVAVV